MCPSSNDLEDGFSSDESTTESEEEAYETWSECSSEHSEDLDSEEESETSSDEASSSSSCLSESSETASDVDETSDSDGETDQRNREDISNSEESEKSDNDDSESESATLVESSDESIFEAPQNFRRRRVPRRASKTQGYLASMEVFDTSVNPPTRLFHFERKVLRRLVDSPPVHHPSASLAVWPYGSGDILFADFQDNTYFTRHLRPSASDGEYRCPSPAGLLLTRNFKLDSFPYSVASPTAANSCTLLLSKHDPFHLVLYSQTRANLSPRSQC